MTAERDEPVFEPDLPPPSGPSALADAEQKLFAAGETPTNGLVLSLGRFGHLCWQGDSSTAVLGCVVLVVLALLVLLVVLLSLLTSDKSWLGTILLILGTAIAGVAGAVIGASAAARRR